MLTPLKTEVLKVDDLSHEARRFRTILWSFQRNLELLFKDTGLTAKIDHAALAEAFARLIPFANGRDGTSLLSETAVAWLMKGLDGALSDDEFRSKLAPAVLPGRVGLASQLP